MVRFVAEFQEAYFTGGRKSHLLIFREWATFEVLPRTGDGFWIERNGDIVGGTVHHVQFRSDYGKTSITVCVHGDDEDPDDEARDARDVGSRIEGLKAMGFGSVDVRDFLPATAEA